MRWSQGDEQGATPRRAALRRSGRGPARAGDGPRQPRTDAERISAIAEGADLPVEDVLREVADFRLALETDMIIAAAALDAATPDLLAEVLDGERAELATFHDRVLGKLAEAAASDELAQRRARRAPRVARWQQVAAVAAVAATVFGVGVTTRTTSPRTTAASNGRALADANSRYNAFSSALTSRTPGAVDRAATQLHLTLQTLIAQHANDPEIAQQTARLLQAEISLLEGRSGAASSRALDQARTLATLLQSNVPAAVRASVAPILAAVAPKQSSKPSPAPSPSPSAKPAPKPASKTSASPTASPDDNPLP